MLKEAVSLSGSRRTVSALGFSPGESTLSAGDVSGTFFFLLLLD